MAVTLQQTDKCAVCERYLNDVSKKYRLRDKLHNTTKLGRVLEQVLEENLFKQTRNIVCGICQHSILKLEKLNIEYSDLRNKMRDQVLKQAPNQVATGVQQSKSSSSRSIVCSTPINTRQHHCSTVRSRSPSAFSTGLSPAEKRPATDQTRNFCSELTARRQLFPSHAEREISTIPLPELSSVQISNPISFCLRPVTNHPLVVTPPRCVSGSPVSQIPMPQSVTVNIDNAAVKVLAY